MTIQIENNTILEIILSGIGPLMISIIAGAIASSSLGIILMILTTKYVGATIISISSFLGTLFFMGLSEPFELACMAVGSIISFFIYLKLYKSREKFLKVVMKTSDDPNPFEETPSPELKASTLYGGSGMITNPDRTISLGAYLSVWK